MGLTFFFSDCQFGEFFNPSFGYTVPTAKIISDKNALAGFIFKKINANKNIKEKKNPGSCLGYAQWYISLLGWVH